jgi:hypothetical protein
MARQLSPSLSTKSNRSMTNDKGLGGRPPARALRFLWISGRSGYYKSLNLRHQFLIGWAEIHTASAWPLSALRQAFWFSNTP